MPEHRVHSAGRQQVGSRERNGRREISVLHPSLDARDRSRLAEVEHVQESRVGRWTVTGDPSARNAESGVRSRIDTSSGGYTDARPPVSDASRAFQTFQLGWRTWYSTV